MDLLPVIKAWPEASCKEKAIQELTADDSTASASKNGLNERDSVVSALISTNVAKLDVVSNAWNAI